MAPPKSSWRPQARHARSDRARYNLLYYLQGAVARGPLFNNSYAAGRWRPPSFGKSQKEIREESDLKTHHEPGRLRRTFSLRPRRHPAKSVKRIPAIRTPAQPGADRRLKTQNAAHRHISLASRWGAVETNAIYASDPIMSSPLLIAWRLPIELDGACHRTWHIIGVISPNKP